MKRGLPTILLAGVALASCATPPAPILPTDAVKTHADAIRLGMERCGAALNIPPNWSARLEGEFWVVRNDDDAHTYIEVRIRKSDAADDHQCEIAFTAD